MKAVLTDERFSDPDWIFERKLDGIRCIAIRDGGRVRMLSRNDLSLNGRYPGIAEALDGQSRRAVRRRRRGGRVRVRADASRTAGARSSTTSSTCSGWTARTCADLPLRERKALLRDALHWDDPLRLTDVPQRGGRGDVRRGVRARAGRA